MGHNIFRTINESMMEDPEKMLDNKVTTGSESVEVEVTAEEDTTVTVEVETDDDAVATDKIAEEDEVIDEDEFVDEDKVVVESLKSKLNNRRKARRTEAKTTKKRAKKVAKKESSTGKVRIRKRKVESLIEDSEDPTISICPICGGKEFDAKSKLCPTCGEPVNKYMVADIDTLDEDNFTTIEINGEDKVLIDEDGNTAIEAPDIVNDVLDDETHKIIIDPSDEDGEVTIDSGVATFIDDKPALESADIDIDEEEATKVAYLRIDEPVSEVAELLSEGNENNVETRDDESGVVLVAKLDGVEEVTESIDGEEVVNDNEVVTVEIELEEIPDGTLVHVENIDNVDDLVDVVNELLPEDAQIEENDEPKEKEATESCKSRKIIESGVFYIHNKGKLESYRGKTVRTKTEAETSSDKLKNTVSSTKVNDHESETNMKEMSTLEARRAKRESAQVRKMLCALGCDPKTLDKCPDKVGELVKLCGNIKEYKSDVKATDGVVTTLESKKPRVRARKTKSSK